MDWAPDMAQLARSPLAQWPPVPPEQSPGQWPGTASGATAGWEPGCPKGVISQDQDVPKGVPPQDQGVLRDVPSQGCHIPGPGFS